jgi:hypothetical protein
MPGVSIFKLHLRDAILSIPNNKGAKVPAKIFFQLFIGRFYPPTELHFTH